MKRSTLKKTPFKPKPTWKRLQPISKDKRRAKFRFVPKDVLIAINKRSSGRCERIMRNLFRSEVRCPNVAMPQPHHVLPRSQGGTHTLNNLIDLCILCHNWCHANPSAAIKEGLLKPYRGFIQGSLED